MKIVRTICFLSASVMGAGLLSSCASNGHHHHGNSPNHHHNHQGHHHSNKQQGNHGRYVRQQSGGQQHASNQNTFKQTSTERRKTQQKRYALSFDEVKAKARVGDADAQYALGYMYYYGQDIERSADKAKFWIRKAAAQGQKRAMSAIKMLGEQTEFAVNNSQEAQQPSKRTQTKRVQNRQRRRANTAQRGRSGYKQVASKSSKRRYARKSSTNRRHQASQHRVNNTKLNNAPVQDEEAERHTGRGRMNKVAHQNTRLNNAPVQNDKAERHTGGRMNKVAHQNTRLNNAPVQDDEAERHTGRSSKVAHKNPRLNNAPVQDDEAERQTTQTNQVAHKNLTPKNAPVQDDEAERNRTAKVAHNTQPTPTVSQPKTLASNVVNELAVNGAQLTSGEKVLLSMPNDHYTLQLFGARKIETAEKIIAENHLDNNAKIYHSTFKSKDWFVLVYGDFRSPSEALTAVAHLPADVQNLKPWVKPIAAVKESIRTSLIG